MQQGVASERASTWQARRELAAASRAARRLHTSGRLKGMLEESGYSTGCAIKSLECALTSSSLCSGWRPPRQQSCPQRRWRPVPTARRRPRGRPASQSHGPALQWDDGGQMRRRRREVRARRWAAVAHQSSRRWCGCKRGGQAPAACARGGSCWQAGLRGRLHACHLVAGALKPACCPLACETCEPSAVAGQV